MLLFYKQLNVECFLWEIIMNVHDFICEVVGCIVTDVDRIWIVDIDKVRKLVLKNS